MIPYYADSLDIWRILADILSNSSPCLWPVNAYYRYDVQHGLYPFINLTGSGERITKTWSLHNDVITGTMASQITSLTIAYSSIYSGTDQRQHQSSASLAFVRETHRWPVNSPRKGPVTRIMFPFDDVIMQINHIALDSLWCRRVTICSIGDCTFPHNIFKAWGNRHVVATTRNLYILSEYSQMIHYSFMCVMQSDIYKLV